jgi:hypothetical protein
MNDEKPEPRGLLFVLVSAIAFFCGWCSAKLRTPKQNVREALPSQDARTAESTQRAVASSLVSQTPSILPQQNQSDGSKNGRPVWEKAAAIGTLGLLVVNIFLWLSTKKAADAAKESADLQRTVVEGTQAATLMSFQHLEDNFLHFGVWNMGGVSAKKVVVNLEVILAELPSNQILWKESFELEDTRLMPKTTTKHPDFELTKFTRNNFEEIKKKKETLLFTWAATFNDGFGHQANEGACFQYLSVHDRPIDFVSCEDAVRSLREMRPPSEQWGNR